MKSFKKVFYLIFTIYSFVLFSCASSKINEFNDDAFEDGIYSYSFERLTESVQTESLYKSSGIDYSLMQSNISSGYAVVVRNRVIELPGFFKEGKTENLILKIEKDGSVYSPTNESISGKATNDGRIAWSGIFEEYEQSKLISEYALFSRQYENQLAPSSMNGSYKVEMNKDFGNLEFELQDGIAKNEFNYFIVDNNGEFRSRFSLKIIQKMNDMIQTNRLADYVSFGKINEDGCISYKMFPDANGNINNNTNDEELKPFVFSGTKISNVINDDKFYDSSKSEIIKEKDNSMPKWFSYRTVTKNNKIYVCAKKSAKSKETAKMIALTSALSQLATQRAIKIKTELDLKTEESENAKKRSLYEVIDIQSSSNIEYKITNEYADKESKTYYVRIESDF